jgi:hypothetical protein
MARHFIVSILLYTASYTSIDRRAAGVIPSFTIRDRSIYPLDSNETSASGKKVTSGECTGEGLERAAQDLRYLDIGERMPEEVPIERFHFRC